MNSRRDSAFSLVEVVLALGVVSFAVVAVIGLFPTALSSNRSSSNEARASQLARAITATVDSQSASFTAIKCYGADDLNLTTYDKSKTVLLYASYPVSSVDLNNPTPPTISASSVGAIYTIELHFDNNPFLTSNNVNGSTQLGVGKVNLIEIRITAANRDEGATQYFYLARNKS